jgi:hypothetical protein
VVDWPGRTKNFIPFFITAMIAWGEISMRSRFAMPTTAIRSQAFTRRFSIREVIAPFFVVKRARFS